MFHCMLPWSTICYYILLHATMPTICYYILPHTTPLTWYPESKMSSNINPSPKSNPNTDASPDSVARMNSNHEI